MASPASSSTPLSGHGHLAATSTPEAATATQIQVVALVHTPPTVGQGHVTVPSASAAGQSSTANLSAGQGHVTVPSASAAGPSCAANHSAVGQGHVTVPSASAAGQSSTANLSAGQGHVTVPSASAAGPSCAANHSAVGQGHVTVPSASAAGRSCAANHSAVGQAGQQCQRAGQQQGQRAGQQQGQRAGLQQGQRAGQQQGQRAGQHGQLLAQLQSDMAFWRQRTDEWYPKWRERTYFVPPVLMHRTQHLQVPLAGETVHVTQPPVATASKGAKNVLLESDVRDDQSQQRVLGCLHELSEANKEVMFVLSRLDFGDYLNQPCYTAAASLLRRPLDLKPRNKHRGDFDLLIVHRHYGIFVGEIKAVGDRLSASLSLQQQDQRVSDKVKQAVKQLDKAGEVLQHILSDLPQQPVVKKMLMLPNVTTNQLQRLLTADPQLTSDLCQCLGVASTADPFPLCLTSEVLANPGQWWQQRVAADGLDLAMTEPVYLDLISRTCGPATTVSVFCSSCPRLGHHPNVRTEGEAVSETAWRFTRLVLHPKQVTVMQNSDPMVFLTGPPGTGKTLMLVLKGLDWLRLGNGEHVQVVSTWHESVAASHMVAGQLEQTAGPSATQRVHLHDFNLRTAGTSERHRKKVVSAAAEALVKAAGGGPVLVIADEASDDKAAFHDLFKTLHRQAPGFQFWSASVYHKNRPPFMTEVVLTEPLRTPPAVSEEVQQSSWMVHGNSVYPYTDVTSPLPSQGHRPRVLFHDGAGHVEKHPPDCEECGREIARLLLDEFHMGSTARTPESPDPPRGRDVLLLGPAGFLDTETDQSGAVTRPASGLLRGMREMGVPVRVVRADDAGAVADMARMAGPDAVAAADIDLVQGLERLVVIVVQPDRYGDEPGARVMAMSRCMAQLVWVKPPECDIFDSDTSDDNDDDGEDEDEDEDDEEEGKKPSTFLTRVTVERFPEGRKDPGGAGGGDERCRRKRGNGSERRQIQAFDELVCDEEEGGDDIDDDEGDQLRGGGEGDKATEKCCLLS